MKKLIFFLILSNYLTLYNLKKLIQADIIIKNGIILTIDKIGNIYQQGSVIVKDSNIIDIATTLELEQKYEAKTVIDATGKIVMPGLINTHNHLTMTVFRGLADDLQLQDWLNEYIFPAEAKFVNAQTVRIGSELAMIEMIRSGTTTFNDMYFYQDEVAMAAQKIGMRGVVSESFIDFPVPNNPTTTHTEEYIRMMYEKYKNDELITVGVAVHSPYTCSAELIKKGMELANELGLNYHIHVAETKWEYDLFMEKHGVSPVKYLDNLGVMQKNVVAAHSVWLNEEDIKIYAERQVGVAHNPECNMKLASGVAPVPQLLEANVKVGLGTDGTASNNNLNLFQEMQTMSLIHKLWSKNPTAIPAKTALQIATIGSAKVLGLDHKIGSLEIGKKADIILLDITKPNTTPLYDVYSALAYSFSGSDVTDVIINGKQIMRNSLIITVDEKEIIEKVNQLSKEIYINRKK